MFTGIIEEVGQVAALREEGEKRRLTVRCSNLLREMKPGGSVSVSGVCLTAVVIEKDSFAADLAQETWQRTSFSRLKPGALVNLELPMRAQSRFDGHIVQGHVDGTGELESLTPIAQGNDFMLSVVVPRDLTPYIVAKGSLAIEGISLTVAAILGTRVNVAIIPHTAAATNLGSLQAGDAVNLEVDVLAKYIEKMMNAQRTPGSLSLKHLKQQGF